MDKAWGFVVAALIVLAAALRIAGIYDDFWLDEIWSWRIVGDLARPWHILTHPSALYDNNHPLNTYLMWLQGTHPGWRLYRLPAVVAGSASLAVAAMILRRRGRVETVLGVLLIGFSYPLVVFSSEARGYALAVLFALLAFDSAERYLQSRGWVANAVFVAACVLGLASHLTFFYVYAGTVVWSLVRLARERRGAARGVWHLLRLHAVPVAWLTFLYLVFVRKLTIGGAPRQPIMEAVPKAIGALLGAGESIEAAVALILIAAGLFSLTLLLLCRRGSDLWVFLLTVIMAPVIVVAVKVVLARQGQPILHRYFLVSYVFFLLGTVLLLSAWLRQRDARRVAAVAVLGAFLALNLYHTVRFLQVGRGHYLDAVKYMATYPPGRTPPPLIVVSSDHAMRTGLVLRFYSHFVPPPQQMVVYDDSNIPRLAPRTHGPPMWVIVHAHQRGQPPAKAFDQYVFEREFPYYGLSGYSWYLYRHRLLR